MELVRGDPSGMRFLAANWMRVMVLAFAGALVLLAGACGPSKSGETVRQTPVEGEQGEGGGNVMLQSRPASTPSCPTVFRCAPARPFNSP